MSLQQVYYTSCTHGLREGKGFQINAASDGMDPRILEQVERLGVYLPPVSLPTRPSISELEQFPVSLAFESLGNGQYLLAQAKYTGTDYSGRYGNYFTHSLVASGPEFEGIQPLPIDFWRSPFWSVTASDSPSLPALAAPPTSGGITSESLHRHLAVPARRDRLADFLTAVEASLTSRRRIVLLDDNEAVAHWIALATRCLPRNLALEVTFNTYVKSPYQSNALIVGVLSRRDADFTFAPHEIAQQYYVFDFQNDEHTPIGTASPFAAFFAEAYKSGGFELARDFQDFAGRTFPDLAVKDLMLALAAFGAAEGVNTPHADTLQLMRWLTPYASRLTPPTLNHLMNQAIAYECLSAASGLVIAVAKGYISLEVRTGVLERYMEWLIADRIANAPIAELREAVSATCNVARGMLPIPLTGIWRRHAERVQDHERAALLLRLGCAFDLLGETPEDWRTIGRDFVGRHLSNGSMQEAVCDLADAACATDLVYGIGLLLTTQFNQYSSVNDIRQLLTRDSLLKTLLQAARDEGNVELYGQLFGVQSREGESTRFGSFRFLHSDIQGWSADKLRTFTAAIAGAWGNGPAGHADAVRLVQEYPEELLHNDRIGWLCRGLVADFSPWRIENERYQLAQLIRQRFHRALGGDSWTVSLVLTIYECKQGQPEFAIPAILEAANSLSCPPSLREHVLDFVAEQMLKLPAEKHATLLIKALNMHENAFLRRYRAAVLSGMPKDPAPYVADLFKIYTREGMPRNRRQVLLNNVLDDVLQQRPGAKHRMVDRLLRNSPPALAQWQDWIGAKQPWYERDDVQFIGFCVITGLVTVGALLLLFSPAQMPFRDSQMTANPEASISGGTLPATISSSDVMVLRPAPSTNAESRSAPPPAPSPRPNGSGSPSSSKGKVVNAPSQFARIVDQILQMPKKFLENLARN